MLTLKCSDAGFDCDHIINGESEKEIMESVADHASKVHGLSADNMDSELIQKIKRLIKSS
jgi:predicted small metal-binding protein